MGKQLIQVPVEVDGFRPLADKSWQLKFSTRQLTADEISVLADNYLGTGWLIFSPDELSLRDIPDTPADADTKTRSQRLRAALYREWESNGKRGDFEGHYNVMMDRFIDFVKERIGA